MAASTCRLCATLTAESVEGMLEQAAEAADGGADVMEFRLDKLARFEPARDLATLLRRRRLPAIVTYRPTWEGGEYTGDEETRLNTLRRAMDLGAEFVDVELQVAAAFISDSRHRSSISTENNSSNTKIIVSKHNFESTPPADELADLVAQIQSTGADVIKFVTTGMDVSDVARIFQLLTRVQIPTIALVMGLKGQISRVLAPKFGGFLTFGSLGPGKESAPGQLTIAELAGVYRVKKVGQRTKVFGLIGNPVGHSKGPLLHNEVLQRLGIDGVYVPFLVDNVRAFLDTFDSPDFAGFSVTIPHKQTAVECCDEVDPLAKAIGAVNTIVRRPSDGKLIGYNTDAGAAISAIEEGLIQREGRDESGRGPLEGRLVVVMGAGGAGRAIAFGAKQKGARVIIANRGFERAQELARSVGAEAIPLSDLREAPPAGEGGRGPVLANTTSVGMHPHGDEIPVPPSCLSGWAAVFDAVYTPMRTALLLEAAARGAAPVSGVEMFVGQAAAQVRLFTGRAAPVDLMREVVVRSLTP